MLHPHDLSQARESAISEAVVRMAEALRKVAKAYRDNQVSDPKDFGELLEIIADELEYPS